MATGPDDVRFQGETGSSRPTSKVTRLTRNGRQADRVLLRIVSSFAPKAQCDGAQRARYQVMATLRQFILGGATKRLIETTASDPLFTLTTNSSARSLLDSHIE